MSGFQVVGLVFAIFVVLGACFLALVLMRITELLLTVKRTMTTLTTAALPLLEEAEQAARTGDSGMAKVAVIMDNIQKVTDNVSAVAATASSAAGGPLVKTVSFTYGVRQIIASRKTPDRAKEVRAELAAARREQRRSARTSAEDDES